MVRRAEDCGGEVCTGSGGGVADDDGAPGVEPPLLSVMMMVGSGPVLASSVLRNWVTSWLAMMKQGGFWRRCGDRRR